MGVTTCNRVSVLAKNATHMGRLVPKSGFRNQGSSPLNSPIVHKGGKCRIKKGKDVFADDQIRDNLKDNLQNLTFTPFLSFYDW